MHVISGFILESLANHLLESTLVNPLDAEQLIVLFWEEAPPSLAQKGPVDHHGLDFKALVAGGPSSAALALEILRVGVLNLPLVVGVDLLGNGEQLVLGRVNTGDLDGSVPGLVGVEEDAQDGAGNVGVGGGAKQNVTPVFDVALAVGHVDEEVERPVGPQKGRIHDDGPRKAAVGLGGLALALLANGNLGLVDGHGGELGVHGVVAVLGGDHAAHASRGGGVNQVLLLANDLKGECRHEPVDAVQRGLERRRRRIVDLLDGDACGEAVLGGRSREHPHLVEALRLDEGVQDGAANVPATLSWPSINTSRAVGKRGETAAYAGNCYGLDGGHDSVRIVRIV